MSLDSTVFGERGRRSWVFQANPEIYRIAESLVLEKQEYWNLRQHWTEVSTGDKVYIWLSGKDAGVYMVGRVISEPVLMTDSDKGQRYWLSSRERRTSRQRVLVSYERSLQGRPLFRDYIRHDPILQELGVIVYPRGTNFPVSIEQEVQLQRWINGGDT